MIILCVPDFGGTGTAGHTCGYVVFLLYKQVWKDEFVFSPYEKSTLKGSSSYFPDFPVYIGSTTTGVKKVEESLLSVQRQMCEIW